MGWARTGGGTALTVEGVEDVEDTLTFLLTRPCMGENARERSTSSTSSARSTRQKPCVNIWVGENGQAIKRTLRSRQYTDEQRLAAVTAYVQARGEGLSIARGAVIAGVPESTVRHWAAGERRALVCQDPEARKTAAERLSLACEEVAERALGIAKERLETAPDRISFRDLVVAGGVGVDKVVALREAQSGGGADRGNALAHLARTPEGRSVLAGLAGVLGEAMRLQRALPEPVTDAEFREIPEGGRHGA